MPAAAVMSNSGDDSDTALLVVTVLNQHDVLMGRGLGASQYRGNKSFQRNIVEPLKADYNNTKSYKEKARLAQQAFEEVTVKGGRFLRPQNPTKGARNVVREGVWYLAGKEEALEKCKQSLRQQREEVKPHVLPADDNTMSLLADTSAPMPPLARYLPKDATGDKAKTPEDDEDDTAAVLFGVPFHRMAQTLLAGGEDQIPMSALKSPTTATATSFGNITNSEQHQPNSHNIGLEESLYLKMPLPDDDGDQEKISEELAVLAVAGCATCSEAQQEAERSQMTNAEQASVMADLFGKLHGNAHQQDHTEKRAKLGQVDDQASLQFALKLFHQELQDLAPQDKQALLRAEIDCCDVDNEFSEARMLRFLHCEGMNPKLAAQRFALYWESRLEIFGPIKYLQRMTLTEAFKDDWVAIEHGVACILPHLDASGRMILYVEPHRRSSTQHTYSPQSLLRAFWYLMEVLSNSSGSSKGFVSVTWCKNATIWDYDHYVYPRLARLQDSAFPIQQVGAHTCSTSFISRRIIDPVISALLSKDRRLRRVFHGVVETEIVGVLEEYGILESMLPTTMGGLVQLSQSEWMTQRRALEEQVSS